MMYRKIYEDLLKWKNSEDRKPLLLQGARQVGKTYLVNTFGNNEYANFVYCNFEQEQDLQDFFTKLEPKAILKQIGYYKKKEIIPEQTLIIFDEIQSCPKALTSLKYFKEEANEYHIVATGSLLGISVNRHDDASFPVGKVQFMTMYPMDFEEFLLAEHPTNEAFVEELKRCYKENSPLPLPLHEDALEAYRRYLFVGGMPEVVDIFVRTGNTELVRVKQKEIIEAYFNDMSKYNRTTEIPKTQLIYRNISSQLSKENKKFQYKFLKSGARASAYSEASEWLCKSGIANRLFKIEDVKLPLNSHVNSDDFKFYMSDTGLCCASQNVLFEDIMLDKLDSNFRGGIAENYINNQLLANNIEAYYWTSKSDAEVDFVTRIDADIVPIEVKSGENVRARSLSVFAERFCPPYSIRISTKNFGLENNIKSVPLYASFCIKNKNN